MYQGWLERLKQSKDGLNHISNAMQSRISSQVIIKQVLEFINEISKMYLIHINFLQVSKIIKCNYLCAQNHQGIISKTKLTQNQAHRQK